MKMIITADDLLNDLKQASIELMVKTDSKLWSQVSDTVENIDLKEKSLKYSKYLQHIEEINSIPKNPIVINGNEISLPDREALGFALPRESAKDLKNILEVIAISNPTQNKEISELIKSCDNVIKGLKEIDDMINELATKSGKNRNLITAEQLRSSISTVMQVKFEESLEKSMTESTKIVDRFTSRNKI